MPPGLALGQLGQREPWALPVSHDNWAVIQILDIRDRQTAGLSVS